jgi:hypothetical protein
MAWQTKIFELADGEGWNDAELAARMGLHRTTVWRARYEHVPGTLKFREGVRRAFPDHDTNRLLWWEDEPQPVEVG